ncbi:Adrenodoxin-like protein 2- mitochondrial [Striga hermonthica]|uniref:2Fe-2S ferredoxin n=1 Tax=Striga hermonthica TaxID=68872 RepID=A0A9N7MVS3_STRHE|nr:Adrenodoxin-like protein 2- mitochondrial [Striga hermonthica]
MFGAQIGPYRSSESTATSLGMAMGDKPAGGPPRHPSPLGKIPPSPAPSPVSGPNFPQTRHPCGSSDAVLDYLPQLTRPLGLLGSLRFISAWSRRRHLLRLTTAFFGFRRLVQVERLCSFPGFIAPSLTERYSYSPVGHNQYLPVLRHKLYSCAAAKVDSDDENETNEKIKVAFVDKDGEETHIKVPVGMSMLEAAHENDIELEGACEGSLACSTCHVIVMDMEQYNRLPDPTDEENDMLDLAFGLTETSRLGCQIIAKPELEGLRLALPSATRNFAVDGHKPKPH